MCSATFRLMKWASGVDPQNDGAHDPRPPPRPGTALRCPQTATAFTHRQHRRCVALQFGGVCARGYPLLLNPPTPLAPTVCRRTRTVERWVYQQALLVAKRGCFGGWLGTGIAGCSTVSALCVCRKWLAGGAAVASDAPLLCHSRRPCLLPRFGRVWLALAAAAAASAWALCLCLRKCGCYGLRKGLDTKSG